MLIRCQRGDEPEPRFGHDFSQVRVHTDAKASESAQAVNALAYTTGRDVVFGVDQYAPGTTQGQMLLAHELTHIVQQYTGYGHHKSIQLEAGKEETAKSLISKHTSWWGNLDENALGLDLARNYL